MTDTHTQSASKTLVQNSIAISGAIFILAIVLIFVAGILSAFALGIDFFAWASGATLAGAGLSIGAILVRAWENARWVIVEYIAANIEKTRAEADKLKAEAGRIGAEAEAITGANNVQIQNVTAGDNSKIKANIQAPRVRINGRDVSWNQINQVNQTQPEPRRLEIPREDVLWMLENFIKAGHSRRVFERETLPYSQLPAYPDAYRALIAALVEGNAIVGRADRAAGRLVVKDIGELSKIVDAAHPRGLVLELPATTPLAESGN